MENTAIAAGRPQQMEARSSPGQRERKEESPSTSSAQSRSWNIERAGNNTNSRNKTMASGSPKQRGSRKGSDPNRRKEQPIIDVHYMNRFIVSETCKNLSKISMNPDTPPLWEDVGAVIVRREKDLTMISDIDVTGISFDDDKKSAFNCPICLEGSDKAAAVTMLPCGYGFWWYYCFNTSC